MKPLCLQIQHLRRFLKVIAAIAFTLAMQSAAQGTQKIFTPLSTQLLDSNQWDLAARELEKIIKTAKITETSEELAQVHASLARCIKETQGATPQGQHHLIRAIALSKNPRLQLTTLYKLANNQQAQAQHTNAYATLEKYIEEYDRFITQRSLREIHFLAATAALMQKPSMPERATQHINKLLATPKISQHGAPNDQQLSQLILKLPQSECNQVISKALQQIQTPPSTLAVCFLVLSAQMQNPALNVSASLETLLAKSKRSLRLPYYQSIALEYYLSKQENQRVRVLASSILSNENPEDQSLQAAERASIALDFIDGKFNRVVSSTTEFLNKWPHYPQNDILRLQLTEAQISLLQLKQATETLEKIKDSQLAPHVNYQRAQVYLLGNQFSESLAALDKVGQQERDKKLLCQSLILRGRIYSILSQNQKAGNTLALAIKSARQQKFDSLEQEAHFENLAHLHQLADVDGTENLALRHEMIATAYRNYLSRFPNCEYGCQMIHLAFDSLSSLGFDNFAQDSLETAIEYALLQQFEAGLENAFYHLCWVKVDTNQGASNLINQLSSEPNGTRKACLYHALAGYYKIQMAQSRGSWGAQLHQLAASRNIYATLQQNLTKEWLPGYLLNDLAKELNRSERSATLSEVPCLQAQQSTILNQRALAQLQQAQSTRISNKKLAAGMVESGIQAAEFLGHSTTFAEAALAEQLELLSHAHRHQEYLTTAKLFLKRFPVSSYKGRVRLLIAHCHLKQNQIDLAIPQLNLIFTNHTTQLDVSAPALNTLCTITWNRNMPASENQPSDKQVAYQLGHRYINTIKTTPEWQRKIPQIQQELNQLQDKVNSWEQSAEVTPVKELLEQLYQSRFE